MPPCTIIQNPLSVRHDAAGHPESEIRMEHILPALPGSLATVTAPPARMEDLLRVHQEEYLCRLKDLSAGCPPGAVWHLDPDTYLTSGTWDAARAAAGAAVTAVAEALQGRPAFALVRPPGHHAGPMYGMGFCLINNAAVAAAYAVEQGSRVAIIDWDVHHGNGTQHIFYDSDRVLYCSIHRSPFFPGTGRPDETGTGAGEGFTVNVPLPRGSGATQYLHLMDEIILPETATFDPDLVIISAGQDALSDDVLGGMRLTPENFGTFTERVCSVARNPPALVLEGGYGRSHGLAIREILSVLDAWG